MSAPKPSAYTILFGKIWAVWGLITFVVTFFIIFIPSMLSYLWKNYPKGQAFFIGVSKVWMTVWLNLVGCPVRVFGKEKFKDNENYVITFNHNALLDVPLSAPFVPGANKTIAKKSFAKVPIFGYFYRRGSVLVDRTSERSRVQSFDDMKAVLSQGMHMCIYPEGARNRTKEVLKPFYEGAFKLSRETGKSVMPCIILGTKEAMPISLGFILFPTKLFMYYLDPISPQGKTAKELKSEVFAKMSSFLEDQKTNS